jgi:hypothetical protein
LDKNTPKQKALIALVDGDVEGDLIIDGANNQVRELLIRNCSISGEIKIFNLKADKIEVTGNANNIILENVIADQTNLCLELKESIIVKNIVNPKKDIEIDGFAKEIIIVNVQVSILDMRVSDFEKIKGRLVKANSIFIPSTNIEFDNLTADHLYFFRENSKGEFSHLINSSLRL